MDNLGYTVTGIQNDVIKDKHISIQVDDLQRKKSIADQIQKQNPNIKEWYEFTKREKVLYVTFSVLKVLLFVVLLYLFLLSLSFMTIGFTMVSGYAIKAGPTIKFILSNPFAALAIGIIATAIMQNATATTSIAVSMVGAGIIPDVQSAIPIIMGSNIGTCVTNSLIALTLAGDANEFKRAFSGATLNDVFNLLTTSILLPVEILSHFLDIVSTKITNLMPFDNIDAISQANFMAVILNPVVDLFIKLDSDAVNALASGQDVTIVALYCCDKKTYKNYFNSSNYTTTFSNTSTTSSLISTVSYNASNFNSSNYENVTICLGECNYWCMPMLKSFGDGGTGLFWIILSIVVLIACLFGIVKVLSLLIVGPIAKGVTIAVNASFPKPFKWCTEIVLFLIAFLLTIVVQSSNIITATLVPLCGVGIVTLQRVYVMTLGSNIGTTVTGILTAFTQPPASLKKSMQLAFVYTLFNVLGVLFWLPIPFLRFPKTLARKLGNIVFQYRWFLYWYVLTVYFIGPIIVFCLALIPMWIGLAIFGLPLIVLIIAVVIVIVLQSKMPRVLPPILRNFKFLPYWIRSLKPLDSKIKKVNCCAKKKKRKQSNTSSVSKTGENDVKQIEDIDEEEIIDNSDFVIPNVIRRFSAIDGLVKTAMVMKERRNTLEEINSSSEDEYDNQAVKDYKRRKSIATISEKPKIVYDNENYSSDNEVPNITRF